MKLFPLLTPAGSDSQIQYNNGGIFGGDSALTWNDATKALTIGSCAVLGPNSAVFQPAADSTTFFQILDADGGTPIFNVDSTNERIGIRNASPSCILDINGSAELSAPLRIVSSSVGNAVNFIGADSVFNIEGNGYFRTSSGIAFLTFQVNGYDNVVYMISNGNLGLGGETAPETRVELTFTAPYFTFHNDTHEDASGGRESRIIAKGEQSGGEETTLGYMEFGHDGAADDEKGYWKLYTNDGSDGTSPTLAVTVDSGQNTTFAKFDQWSVTAGITAVTPGVQGDGALITTVNEISVCANANDAVTLPAAVAGRHIVIINNGANTLEIWPASGDNAGGGVDTGVTLAAGSNVHYVAYDGTNWESI